MKYNKQTILIIGAIALAMAQAQQRLKLNSEVRNEY